MASLTPGKVGQEARGLGSKEGKRSMDCIAGSGGRWALMIVDQSLFEGEEASHGGLGSKLNGEWLGGRRWQLEINKLGIRPCLKVFWEHAAEVAVRGIKASLVPALPRKTSFCLKYPGNSIHAPGLGRASFMSAFNGLFLITRPRGIRTKELFCWQNIHPS